MTVSKKILCGLDICAVLAHLSSKLLINNGALRIFLPPVFEGLGMWYAP